MIGSDVLALLSLSMIAVVVGFLVLFAVEWLLEVGREVVAEVRYRLAWRRYERSLR